MLIEIIVDLVGLCCGVVLAIVTGGVAAAIIVVVETMLGCQARDDRT